MDFLKLLIRLHDQEVDFVIVGGYASMMLGSDLITQDLDICIRLSPENLNRIFDAVEDLNPRNRMHPQRPPLTREIGTAASLKNLYLLTDLGPLDCLGSVLGLGGYDEVEAHARSIMLPFGSVRTLDFDGLIRAKSALNREKDRLTVEKLKAIRDRLRQR